MRIHVEPVPHQSQRHGEVGDWQFRNGDLYVQVSQLDDWRMFGAVAIHEIYEALSCRAAGIPEQQIDVFDKQWVPHDNIEEPGDDPAAPYHRFHIKASIVERLLAAELSLNWDEYADTVDALYRNSDDSETRSNQEVST